MLIKPVITPENEAAIEILKQAGIDVPDKQVKNNLADILTNAGLDLEAVINEIAGLAMDCADPTIKSKNLDTVLKLHKVFEPAAKEDGTVIINILPLTKEHKEVVPTILIPRDVPVLQEA